MNNEEFNQLKDFIYENTEMTVDLERTITAVPALAPENGGDGESKKFPSGIRIHGRLL